MEIPSPQSSGRATGILALPSSLPDLILHQHGRSQRAPDKKLKALGSLSICLSTFPGFARDQTIFQF